jgi:hypothetical protein
LDYAFGIIKVDGLEPSPDFWAMAEKEKRGEMTLSRLTMCAHWVYDGVYEFGGILL